MRLNPEVPDELERDSDSASETAASGKAAVPQPRRRRVLSLVAAAAVVAVIAGWFWLSAEKGLPRLTNPSQITTASEVEGYPSWRPDGTQLAYESSQNGNWDIWVTQVSGGRPVNLTEDYPGEDRFPSWSPDGSQIAFYSKRNGGGYFVMPALGGEPRKIAPAPRPRRDGPPQWAPDGSRLAFAGGGSAEIVSIERGSTERLTLPGLDRKGWHLSWSPDGRFFAYTDAVDE